MTEGRSSTSMLRHKWGWCLENIVEIWMVSHDGSDGPESRYSWYAHNAYRWGGKNLMHYDTYARPHMSHRGDICDICQNCDMKKYSIHFCFSCNICDVTVSPLVCSMCWTHRTKACSTSGRVTTGCHWCELPYLGVLITCKTALTGRSFSWEWFEVSDNVSLGGMKINPSTKAY